jgi:hypothetical protein
MDVATCNKDYIQSQGSIKLIYVCTTIKIKSKNLNGISQSLFYALTTRHAEPNIIIFNVLKFTFNFLKKA